MADDGQWVTINGAPVLLKDGVPQYGGGKGKSPSQAGGSGGSDPVGETSLNTYQTKNGLDEYVNEGYSNCNEALRSKAPLEAWAKRDIERVDGAFVHHGENLSSDETVWRGGRDLFDGKPDSEIVGMEFTDKAYCSTSRDVKAASAFAQGKGSTGKSKVLYEIRVPKGSRVIDVQKHFKTDLAKEEKEVLLRRGSRFRVVGRTSRGYQLEYVLGGK